MSVVPEKKARVLVTSVSSFLALQCVTVVTSPALGVVWSILLQLLVLFPASWCDDHCNVPNSFNCQLKRQQQACCREPEDDIRKSFKSYLLSQPNQGPEPISGGTNGQAPIYSSGSNLILFSMSSSSYIANRWQGTKHKDKLKWRRWNEA